VRRAKKLDVADIFRRVLPKISSLNLSKDKLRVCRAIVNCRTAVLGGHLNQCSSCGFEEQSYNSCWNRHCPKCQGGQAFQWTEKRAAELLPVPYFHLVFTIAHELSELCYANKKIMYDILFRASSDTLLEVTKNNLGLKPGFFGVLHSWNQELGFHPHVHYAVPGGGLDDAGIWRPFSANGKFFLPVRILSRVFRGKFIAALKSAYHSNKLFISAKLSHLRNPQDFEHLISRAASRDWVVYAKRPFAGPDVVLKYLSSYTHRVAISNRRLKKINNTTVSFTARNNSSPGKKRLITLSHETFVRRFLRHVLPKSFRRIRYFGFMSLGQKKNALNHIWSQIGTVQLPSSPKQTPNTCPACNSNTLRSIKLYYPHSSAHHGGEQPILTSYKQPLCLSPPFFVH